MNLYYAELLDQVKAYQPARYHATRNYINGAVTAWSPYISRGFLSPVMVMKTLKAKYNRQEWLGFMQQMAWREYFQRVWQHKGDMILQDLKSTQSNVLLNRLPSPILSGTTGIHAIDNAIHQLYDKGYMHNHLRMYIAMLHSNIFKAAWLPGAQWMYAHLLDHDPAANFLSWQWVAGTFSSKQYIANQENINRYTNTNQGDTFLDTNYEKLTVSIFDEAGALQPTHMHRWMDSLDQDFHIDMSAILKQIEQNNVAEKFDRSSLDLNQSYCIYNTYNIDPLWHANENINRILLLEPQHFKKFPITEKVLQFVIDLAKRNIPALQIFIGNFEELTESLQTKHSTMIYFKEHPTTLHYQGVQEQRDWLFPQITGYFPSFFGYWKKCEKLL